MIFRDEKTKNKNSLTFRKDTDLVNEKSLHGRFSDLKYVVTRTC